MNNRHIRDTRNPYLRQIKTSQHQRRKIVSQYKNGVITSQQSTAPTFVNGHNNLNSDLTEALLDKNYTKKHSKSKMVRHRRRIAPQLSTIATYTQKPRFTVWGPLTNTVSKPLASEVSVYDRSNLKSQNIVKRRLDLVVDDNAPQG